MARTNVIYIHPNDELASIIDRIVSHESSSIILVIPEEAYIAHNVLNFRLLKREADSAGKELTIISKNPRIRELALSASLRAKEALEKDLKHTVSTNIPLSRKPEKLQAAGRPMTDILPPSASRQPSTSREAPIARMAPTALPRFQKAQPQDMRDTRMPTAEKTPVDSLHDTKELGETFSVSTYDPQQVERLQSSKKHLQRKRKGFVSVVLFPPRLFAKSLGGATHIAKKRPLAALLVLGLAGILAVTAYVGMEVLPRATITLYPKSVHDTLTLPLVADSNISSANTERGILPAQIFTHKKEQVFTFDATGSAELRERAHGTIRVYNEYSSSPQTLVASTRFVSSDGKLFRTIETVVVPGARIEGGKIIASSIEIPVEAADPGEAYNIGSTSFSIPGFKGDPRYLSFYGKSEKAMQGGAEGVVTVVTQENLNDARKKVEAEFLPLIAQELRGKVVQNLMLLEDTFSNTITTFETSAETNAPTKTFTARVIVEARVVAIRDEDFRDAIGYAFLHSTEYSKDFELSEKRTVRYEIKEVDYEKGVAKFTALIDQVFNRRFDTTKFVNEIRGKNEVEVRRLLSQKEELSKAQVRFWPFWVKRVPQNKEDIELIIQYEQ